MNEVVDVEWAFDVLEIDDPFALMMGDSKSDLRVLEWIAEHEAGVSAAPEHASRGVLDHVVRTDELVFDQEAGERRPPDGLRAEPAGPAGVGGGSEERSRGRVE